MPRLGDTKPVKVTLFHVIRIDANGIGETPRKYWVTARPYRFKAHGAGVTKYGIMITPARLGRIVADLIVDETFLRLDFVAVTTHKPDYRG